MLCRTSAARAALCLGLGLALAAGCTWGLGLARFEDTCGQIRADTFRLHIQAESDAVSDQNVKLRVRDAVLAVSETLYRTAGDKSEAERIAAHSLGRLQFAAAGVLAQCGVRCPVQVYMVNMAFSTTKYQAFTLPAGHYDALRIELGQHRGHNWWCVLYPQLCLSACSGGYETPAENALITSDYEIRFAAVDWWEKHFPTRSF